MMEFCNGSQVLFITVLNLKVFFYWTVRSFVLCKQIMSVANVVNSLSSELHFVWTIVTWILMVVVASFDHSHEGLRQGSEYILSLSSKV